MKFFERALMPGYFSKFSASNILRTRYAVMAANLAADPANCSGAGWTKTSVVANGYLLTSTGVFESFVSQPIPLASGTPAVTSFQVRKGSSATSFVEWKTSIETRRCQIYWVDGKARASMVGAGTVTVEDGGDGWFTVAVFGNLGEDNQLFKIYPATGTAVGSIWVRNIQFEFGTVRNKFIAAQSYEGEPLSRPYFSPRSAPHCFWEPNGATNRCLSSERLDLSPWGGVASASSDGFVAKTTAGTYEFRSQNIGAVAANGYLTLTLTLWAGTSNVCDVGLYGAAGGWGNLTGYVAQVIEGPGVIIGQRSGTLTAVGRLSSLLPTVVRVTRLFSLAESAASVYIYPAAATSTVVGRTVRVTRVQVESGQAYSSYVASLAVAGVRAPESPTALPLTEMSIDDSGNFGGAWPLYCSALDEAPQWVAQAYSVAGTRVVRNGRLYQLAPAVSAAAADVPDGVNPKWVMVGPSNRNAMFDHLRGGGTRAVWVPASGHSELFGVFSGRGNAILFSGIKNAEYFYVKVVDSSDDSVLFEKSFQAGPGEASVRSQYFIGGLYSATGNLHVFYGLRNTVDSGVKKPCELRLASMGVVQQALGDVRYGVRGGVRDFSKKDADEFGQYVFVPRTYSKTLTCTLEVKKSDLPRAYDSVAQFNGQPLVWVASEDDDYQVVMVVFGFFKDFYVSVDYPTKSLMVLEIEGLT